MTTYLGKSCSFGLPRVPLVNCRQFMYLVISLMVLRAGYGIWLYQFLIIAYLFTLLCNVFVAPVVPKHFDHGNRKLSIIQALIRNRCSNLNHDLYLNRLRDTGVCDCGSEREDAEHYIFECHKYLRERRKLFWSTHRYHPLNLDTVLRGRDALSFEDNVAVFNSVQ